MKANNKTTHENAVLRPHFGMKLQAVTSAPEQKGENEESCFLFLNLNHQIITLTSGFARILNINVSFSSTPRYKRIYSCLPTHHTDWFGKLTATAQTGKSCHHEMLVKVAGNTERWVKFDFSPVYNRKSIIKGIICICTNINKEKMQEQKLAKQKLLLIKIADTYSHQLRHPLTNILAIINIMKDDDKNMTNLYFEYLEKASHQLDAVIHQVVNQTYTAA